MVTKAKACGEETEQGRFIRVGRKKVRSCFHGLRWRGLTLSEHSRGKCVGGKKGGEGLPKCIVSSIVPCHWRPPNATWRCRGGKSIRRIRKAKANEIGASVRRKQVYGFLSRVTKRDA